MSAPDTNTEKTKNAHKTPIVGMLAMVAFALVLLFALVTWLGYWGNEPGDGVGVDDGVSVEAGGEDAKEEVVTE